jgi:hypothetical protein
MKADDQLVVLLVVGRRASIVGREGTLAELKPASI